jgi:hypothetical protein
MKAQAQNILHVAQDTLNRMGPILGIQPHDPLVIVTYNDYGDMKQALPFRSYTQDSQLRYQVWPWVGHHWTLS